MSFTFTDIQLEWLDYLESNPKQQIAGNLGKVVEGKERFCCLGAAEKVCGTFYKPEGLKSLLVFGKESALGVLTSETKKRLNLRSSRGDFQTCCFVGSEYYECLTQMNDRGMTWAEIAQYIRENPTNVFISNND